MTPTPRACRIPDHPRRLAVRRRSRHRRRNRTATEPPNRRALSRSSSCRQARMTRSTTPTATIRTRGVAERSSTTMIFLCDSGRRPRHPQGLEEASSAYDPLHDYLRSMLAWKTSSTPPTSPASDRRRPFGASARRRSSRLRPPRQRSTPQMPRQPTRASPRSPSKATAMGARPPTRDPHERPQTRRATRRPAARWCRQRAANRRRPRSRPRSLTASPVDKPRWRQAWQARRHKPSDTPLPTCPRTSRHRPTTPAPNPPAALRPRPGKPTETPTPTPAADPSASPTGMFPTPRHRDPDPDGRAHSLNDGVGSRRARSSPSSTTGVLALVARPPVVAEASHLAVRWSLRRRIWSRVILRPARLFARFARCSTTCGYGFSSNCARFIGEDEPAAGVLRE